MGGAAGNNLWWDANRGSGARQIMRQVNRVGTAGNNLRLEASRGSRAEMARSSDKGTCTKKGANRERRIIELREKIKAGGRQGRRELNKRKGGFIKRDMTGDGDSIGGKIKTPISFVVERITEENTKGGARGELISSSGGEIGVAFAPKDTEVRVGGLDTIESKVWRGKA